MANGSWALRDTAPRRWARRHPVWSGVVVFVGMVLLGAVISADSNHPWWWLWTINVGAAAFASVLVWLSNRAERDTRINRGEPIG